MKLILGLRENNFNFQTIFFMTISFFGLFLLLIMYLWAPKNNFNSFFPKTVVLSIFIMVCISGIIAATRPSTCKALLRFKKDSKVEKDYKTNVRDGISKHIFDDTGNSKNELNSVNIKFEGHHPDCGKFYSHTLNIKGKKYCPGCLGLLIGAFVAIGGTLIYYFMGYPYIYGEILFWIGFCTVFLSLFCIVFFNLERKLKFIVNLVLVIGSFLVLLALDNVKGNLIIELYFFFLIIFWILTRITISESSHEIICRECVRESICVYE